MENKIIIIGVLFIMFSMSSCIRGDMNTLSDIDREAIAKYDKTKVTTKEQQKEIELEQRYYKLAYRKFQKIFKTIPTTVEVKKVKMIYDSCDVVVTWEGLILHYKDCTDLLSFEMGMGCHGGFELISHPDYGFVPAPMYGGTDWRYIFDDLKGYGRALELLKEARSNGK